MSTVGNPAQDQSSKCEFDVAHTITLVCLGSIAYGLHLAVGSMTIYWVLREVRNGSYKRHCLYIAMLAMLASINYFFAMINYLYKTKTKMEFPFHIVPDIAALIIAFSCNALLLYRCYVVWDSMKIVLIFPVVALSTAIVYGCLQLGQLEGHIAHMIAYWSITLFLNVLFTMLISGRIFWIRGRLRKLLGKDFSDMYGSNMAIIVESSLLYTFVSVFGIIPMVTSNGQFNYAFSPLLVQTECIASELIILRLVVGSALPDQWTTNTRVTQDLGRSYSIGRTSLGRTYSLTSATQRY